MLKEMFLIIGSFFFTFIALVPFIGFLYKYNIRRVSETSLSALLPNRALKLGTPIMGGSVIIFSLLVFLAVFFRHWDYFPAIVAISLIGSFFGFLDEYINTLGRSLFAFRITKGHSFSFFPVAGLLEDIKGVLLFPWRLFEKVVNVAGSNQKGIKNPVKLAMYLFVASLPCIFLYLLKHGTYTFLPLYGYFDLGFFYYILVFFLSIFFGVAFGLTDGMDGLSAGLHSLTFLAILAISSVFGAKEISAISAILVGAELAFLYFNVKPARIQMSDVGTLPLGVLFVFLLSQVHLEFIAFILGFIYLLEILSSVLQSWSVKLFKRRILLVAPLHHHFERLGWDESKVVERFWLFGALFSIFGVFISLL